MCTLALLVSFSFGVLVYFLWFVKSWVLPNIIVCLQYGLVGHFWYAAGAVIHLFLFAIMAAEIRIKCPGAKTYLQVSKLWPLLCNFIFVYICVCGAWVKLISLIRFLKIFFYLVNGKWASAEHIYSKYMNIFPPASLLITPISVQALTIEYFKALDTWKENCERLDLTRELLREGIIQSQGIIKKNVCFVALKYMLTSLTYTF